MRPVDNLMPLAASVVVLLFAAGVLIRQSTLWYEWAAALAGVAFAVWFWFTELMRARRKAGGRGRPK